MKTKYRMDRLEEQLDRLHSRVNEVEYVCKGLKTMSVKTGGHESLYVSGKARRVPSYHLVEINAVLEALMEHLNLTVSIVPPQGRKVALEKAKP